MNNKIATTYDESCDTITLETVWSRTKKTIQEAVQTDGFILIDAPPGSGKTTSLPEIVNRTKRPVTYLAQREDLYDQMDKLCDDAAIPHETIPSPQRACPTFMGLEGGSWQHEVTELYAAGVSGRRIHNDREPPCLPGCEYMDRWKEIHSTQPAVLIGNPRHAYVEAVIEDRVVIIDEFPGTDFITHFEHPGPLISTFLQDTPELSYSDYTDFLRNRSGQDLTLAYAYQDVNFDPCPEAVLETDGDVTTVNARAGLLTYGVGAMADLGNGFESTRQYTYNDTLNRYAPVLQPWDGFILGNRTLIRDRNNDEVWMLSPPDLSTARCVVGLDGTPTMLLWNTVFDTSFQVKSILNRREWKSYIRDAVNVEILRTNDSPKSYYNPNNVTPLKDTKIAFWIRLHEDEKPGLITSKKALHEYESYNDGEIFDYVSDSLNFGGVRSYNGYKDKTLGYITGSRHYGDDYIKQWAAVMGHAVEGERVGDDRVYGEIGNQIRDHMRVETIQDVLRFGRGNEDRTKVYVNTSALPEWIPSRRVHGTLYSENCRNVMKYMMERSNDDELATVQEVSTQTNISNRHARQLLNDLTEEGYVRKTKEKGFGTNGVNLYEWDS